MIRSYIALSHLQSEEYQTLNSYLDIISGKASGELFTAASWMRHFLINHPAYQQDSIVTEEMTFDLIQKIKKLNASDFLKKY